MLRVDDWSFHPSRSGLKAEPFQSPELILEVQSQFLRPYLPVSPSQRLDGFAQASTYLDSGRLVLVYDQVVLWASNVGHVAWGIKNLT